MTFQFKKATRTQVKLRLAIVGPSGSGKTYTALTLARTLGKRIAVIDSEHESASLYADDVAEFDTLQLTTFAPRTYVEAIHAAEKAGYDVIVVDSLTHAWSGKGGALEMVDNAAKRSQAGNSYTAWRDVTPEHNALVDAMVQCKAHLIVTMRSKTEYVLQEDARGKKIPKKIGMAPIQRDGLEYEFTVVAEMDLDHNFMVSKTRCASLDGAVVSKPGPEIAESLLTWLNSGAPAQERERHPFDDGPAQRAAANGTSTPNVRKIQTTSTASATRSPGEATEPAPEPKRDEYGIAIPTAPCPVVTKDGPNKGKRWDELPGGLIGKMLAEHDKMNVPQRVWILYLNEKRQARKAAEARAAEAAAVAQQQDAAAEAPADSGGWVAGDEAAVPEGGVQ